MAETLVYFEDPKASREALQQALQKITDSDDVLQGGFCGQMDTQMDHGESQKGSVTGVPIWSMGPKMH